jgi:hypothetical protein
MSRRVWIWSAWLALGVLALLGAGGLLWWASRSQPDPVRDRWYRGVDYERMVLQSPRPVVAHVVRIDLREPGIDFVITPPEPSPAGDLRSQTTSAFVARSRVQLAVNASYFYPFRNEHPLDYEPHPGDPVHVVGSMAARGVRFGQALPGEATLYISRDRMLSFGAPHGELWDAISGMGYVVERGAPAQLVEDTFTWVPYPRSLIGTDAAGRTLILVVIDGKQPGYSEGVTLPEAAELLLRLGVATAIQLDGGGSATLARRVGDGVEVVSMPANFKVPGWERSVAAHLGVRAAER